MPTMTSNAKRKGPIGKATQTVGQVGDYLDSQLGRAIGMNPAKFDRCVRDVQASGEDVNAYAVCTAAGAKNKRKGNINWSPERQGLYDAMEKARSSWVRASAQTGHKVTGGVKELEQKYKQAEARFVEAVRKTNPLAGGMTLRQLINHRLEQAYEMKAKLKTLPPRKQADYQREVYKAFSAVEVAEGVWHELGETREAEARIKSIFMGIPWENKRNPDDPEFADYGRRVVVISKVGRHVEEMEGTIYRTLQGSGGIVYEVDFGHGPQRLSGEQSRTIKFLNGKANPEMDAATMYESFHGMPSEEVTEFEEEIHYHENLSELGVLCGLVIETEYAGTMALAFSGYCWDKKEGAFELKAGRENPLFGGLFGGQTTHYSVKHGTKTTTTGRLNYKGHQIVNIGGEYEIPKY